MSDDIEPVCEVLDAEEVDLDESDSARLIRESTRVEMHTSHEGPHRRSHWLHTGPASQAETRAS